jgi:outer membrane protein OmpA-like peptidoglycan-associated protein
VKITLSALGVLAAAALSATASAQGFALDKFEPAPFSDRFFEVQSFDVGSTSPLYFAAGVLGDYAKNPLVEYTTDANGNPDKSQGAVVGDQLFLHVGAELGIYQRVMLSADFPVALVNSGDSSSGVVGISGAAAGDLRGGLRLRLLGDSKSAFGAAINGYVWFPTGDQSKFTGQGSVRGSPSLALGGRVSWFFWGANGGALLESSPQSNLAGVTVGHQIVFGGGVGASVFNDRLSFGPEVNGDKIVSGASSSGDGSTNAELLVGAKVHIGPLVIGAAGGPGLTKGIGTPAARGVFSLAYAPQNGDRDGDGILDSDDACPDDPGPANANPAFNGCPDRDHDGIPDKIDACPDDPGAPNEDPKLNGCPDRDHDGIPDKIDACPDAAGPKNDDPKLNGCPDRDGDGIPDPQDACPDVKGVHTEDPKTNGCPPDRDGDGIPDAVDACPDVKGVADPDPKKNGCPKDTDGDGIPDDQDACPLEKGPRNSDPKKNGCPTVFVKEGHIQILEQVQFKTGSDVILPASDDLLTKVAAVFKEHPEIKKVLVEGHTDNQGAHAYNVGLSKRRAASVKKWLVKRGKIEPKRMESEGFGPDRPIGDNSTAEGRQLNRRVEFKILDPK